jgi:hypothetical protein
MRSYYNRDIELTKEIKLMQEALKLAQKELKQVAKIIAEYENLPASSGGKVKVRVIKTYKLHGEEPVTETSIDFVDYEIYAASQEEGASEMCKHLANACGVESASVKLERIQD